MILNSPYISGSLTVTGNTNLMGTLTVTGSLSGTASFATNATNAVNSTNALSASSVLPLSQSVSINGFTSFYGNISGSQPANNPSSSLILISGSILPASGSTSGSSAIYVNTVMSASANNQTLVGLDINPTFNNDAFTGVTNWAARFNNNVLFTQGSKSINIATPVGSSSGGTLTLNAGNATTSGTGGNIVLQPGTGAGGPGHGTITLGNSSNWNGATVNGTLTVTYSGPNTGTTLQVNAGGQNGLTIAWDNLTPFMQYGLVSTRQSRFTNSTSYTFDNNFIIGSNTNSGFRLDVSGSTRITNNLTVSGSTQITGSLGVTGSINSTGNITTTGTLTAQTLVVQTVTSSIVYSSGSNIFGNQITNTQTFTGSVNITGSQNIFGNVGTNYAAQSNIRSFIYDNSANYSLVAQQDGSGAIAQFSGNSGAVRMYISASGNIGIGTSTPTSTLQIFKTAYTGNQFKTYAELQAAPTTLTYSTSDGFGLILNMYEAVSGNPYTRYADIVANTGDVSDSAMRFFTKAYSANTAERMRITSAGNVGIGTTSPNGRFEVATGSAGVTVGDFVVDTTNKYVYVGRQSSTSGDNTTFVVRDRTGTARATIPGGGSLDTIFATNASNFNVTNYGGTSLFFVSGSGNVGIGTTSPTEKLDVIGGAVAAGNGTIRTGITYSTLGLIGTFTNHHLGFITNGTEKMRITSGSHVYIGEGYSNTNHRINLLVSQGSNVLVVSAYSTAAADTAVFCSVDGAGANAAAAALKIGNNTTNTRSINAGGSINASGADYAEYMTKATEANIAKGDIVGVDENGLLTNIFEDSKSFVVKSTNPSYVGGDTWGTEEALGEKRPQKTTDQTDEEFATLTDIFEAKLEIERAKVDRIAFSGQVPCNVTGATVGDYVVPIELENGKIGGQAVTNPTFEQYQISVGKVWKIMEDGRAWIAVKIG